MSRNVIFDALLAFGEKIAPPGGASAWAETGRRLKDPTQARMPALFQCEGDDEYQSQLGQMRRRELQVTWVVYQNAGADQGAIPSEASQDFKDALDAAFSDRGVMLETLGGLTFAAFIKGAVRRFSGDFDGIELITVPISIILP
jgi:hypothetical protein